jgi:DNA-binding transcriptional ArsR family regulator
MDENVMHDDSGDNGGPSLSNDDIYDQLANRRRRYALHHLKQTGEPVAVRELAEQVAAWENDTAVDDLDSQERKRVYIALYQSHLSTMDEAGLVTYDDEAGTVELADPLVDTDIYIEVVRQEDVPWDLYYLGLSAANGVLLALAWLEVQPFTRMPDLGWGLLVLVTFAVSAFVQLYYRRRMQLGDDGPPPGLENAE